MVDQLLSAFGNRMIINPYRYVGAPTTLVSDTFTDTNGTDLAAHAPDVDLVGNGWIESQSGRMDIQLNKTRVVNSQQGIDWRARIETTESDVVISMDATIGSTGGGVYILLRDNGGSAFWLAGYAPFLTELVIYEYNAGFTKRASTSLAVTIGNTITLEATASGTTISLTADGANLISYGSASLNETVTDHGIWSEEEPHRMDNYEIVSP